MINKIGIIGVGNMGEAILARIDNDYTVLVCEKDSKRVSYLTSLYKVSIRDLKMLVQSSDCLILAVKPQDMDEVLKEIKKYTIPEQLIISIAAGISTSYIEKFLGPKAKVIRTMPNMPAQIGEGITAICKGKHAKEVDLHSASQIFNKIGETVIVDEDLIDAITAVSGSGPAYVFLFMESMIKAAQALGLKEDLAKKLVEATVLGSVHLLKNKKEDPAQLRAKVTSKGGTTQAALNVFQRNKFEKIFTDALKAAKKRAKELSKK